MNAVLRSSLTLAICTCVAIAGLSLVHAMTRKSIQQAQRQFLLQGLSAVLPQGIYDNELLSTGRVLKTSELGTLTVYAAYRNIKPTAAVIKVTSTGGYNGDIKLLLGITIDGLVTGVRVIEHQETPGLGDDIEIRRSNWITQFETHSLQPSPNNWNISRQGGSFDAMTGATITSNAVIHTVRDALLWYKDNNELIFRPD